MDSRRKWHLPEGKQTQCSTCAGRAAQTGRVEGPQWIVYLPGYPWQWCSEHFGDQELAALSDRPPTVVRESLGYPRP